MAPNDKPTGTSTQQKSLKQSAEENRSRLGDPTSLKAETSSTEPTENDRGALNDSDSSREKKGQSTRPVPDSSESLKQGPTGTGMQQKGKKHKTLKEAAQENPTMLGDPVSLKAETADSEPTPNDRGAQSSVSAEKAPEQKPMKSKI